MRLRLRVSAAALSAAMAFGAPLSWAQTAPLDGAAALAIGRAAYEAGRFAEARAALRPAALSGDPDAQHLLGSLFDRGQGGAPDPAAAFQWYWAAAALGHRESQFNVGVMLDAGRGVSRDPGRAALWYARAAILGDDRAAFNLAMLYASGEGTPKNPSFAAAWFAQAARSIPEAAKRLSALETARGAAEGAADRTLPAPRPTAKTFAAPGEDGASMAQLVWLPGENAPPSRYFVEVVALDGGPPAPVFAAFVERSAVLAPLPGPPEDFAFRVLAVSAAQGAYASSGWRALSARGVAPGLAQGPESRGLARYDVTARYAEEDAEARALLQDAARDLALANIALRLEPQPRAPAAARVIYAFAQDRPAAEDLAELLSLGPEALRRAAPTEATPPGTLIVSLKGGRSVE